LKQLWLGESDFWQSFYAPPASERVDVIVPVLHRPQNIEPLMKSLLASTGLARVWFVVEDGDDEVALEAVRCGGRVYFESGSFAKKVNFAFNRLRNQGPAPWVFLAGDDVRFRPGWLDHAQEVARRYGAQVVGTNDLANPRVMRGEHATHMLISRDYVEEHGSSWDGAGVVCHEGYRHWFVDDEIVSVAKRRGVFQVSLASEVEHLHPMVGKAENDAIYDLGAEHSKQDEELFKARFKKFVGL
jgi:glycosyltransferase involved in cell wall biosynthesis